MTAVALRTNPPRSSTGGGKDKPGAAASPSVAAMPAPAEDGRSPMQRLLDKFR